MAVVWPIIIIVCLIMLLITNPTMAFSSMLTGAEKTISLSLKLWGIYAVWLGVLHIIQETGLDKKIARVLSPIINKLIGKTDNETKNQIAINLTANIFGMGNASTPSGIEGMAGLGKGKQKITPAMAMFFILNTCSIQLVPSTLIGLRAFAGSASPSDIIIPGIISSIAGLVSGIVLIKVIGRMSNKREKKVDLTIQTMYNKRFK